MLEVRTDVSLDQVSLGESEAIQGVAPSTWSSCWAPQGGVQTVLAALGHFALRCPLYKVIRRLPRKGADTSLSQAGVQKALEKLEEACKDEHGAKGSSTKMARGAHALTAIGVNALKRDL